MQIEIIRRTRDMQNRIIEETVEKVAKSDIFNTGAPTKYTSSAQGSSSASFARSRPRKFKR